MSDKTKISWCDATWNPVDGCTPVPASEGCKKCYAAGIAKRFWGDRKFSDVQCHEDRLDIPLKWRKPRRIFVSSMGDLFHKDVPFKFVNKIFDTLRFYERFDGARNILGTTGLKETRHTYMILTKRPERAVYFAARIAWRLWPKCLQFGVSIENQEQADKRIPELVKIPAAARFVSVEPMLDVTNLRKYLPRYNIAGKPPFSERYGYKPAILWVVAGCESGPGARETKIEWVRDLRDQCKEAGIPFFLKQLRQNGKLVKMPLLDGVRHDALPEGG